ncbi:MAG: hypothetical protein AAF502_17610 [Bacteroidota bacterium]
MNIKLNWIVFIFCLIPIIGCDSGAICVYANKNVSVENNTAFNIDVIVRNTFGWYQVGSLQPFETNSFTVPHSVIIEAGNAQFSDQLFVDPCRQTLVLTVDD